MRAPSPGVRSLSLPPVEPALAALGGDALRALVLDLVPLLPPVHRAQWVEALLERAGRSGAEGAPPDILAPSEPQVRTCLEAIEAAKAQGHAEPATVDAILLFAKSAFLAREFSVAARLYRAVLVPATTAEFDLGQDECIEEVLGVEVGRSVVEAAVCVYWTSAPGDRACAILEFFDELGESSTPWRPLHDLAEVAIGPLPAFDAFVRAWRSLLEVRVEERAENRGHSSVESWWEEAKEAHHSS